MYGFQLKFSSKIAPRNLINSSRSVSQLFIFSLGSKKEYYPLNFFSDIECELIRNKPSINFRNMVIYFEKQNINVFTSIKQIGVINKHNRVGNTSETN